MKPGAEFQQCRHAAVDIDVARVRMEDSSNQLEHGALTRAVRADDADGRPWLDAEGQVTQRVEVLVDPTSPAQDDFLEIFVTLLVDPKAFGDPLKVDGCRHQTSSAKRRLSRP